MLPCKAVAEVSGRAGLEGPCAQDPWCAIMGALLPLPHHGVEGPSSYPPLLGFPEGVGL